MADKYDKILSEGLTRLKESEFRYVPAEEDIKYTFSNKYLKSKDKLLKKLGHSYWKFVNTVAKKVAVLVVTLIITFSSLMTVDAFRDTIINFIVTIYKTFSVIVSSTESKTSIEIHYSIENLPTNYICKISDLNKAVGYQIWNNKHKQIFLTQQLMSTPNYFNSEHGELSEAIINDTPCLICKDEIQYYCYWEFDGYRFELIYPVDLGEEFMSEVVGNLIEINPEDMQS